MKNFLVFLLILMPLWAISQKRSMTTDDGLDMINLSGSYISPDGQIILYGKSKLDWDKNKRKTTYHYVSQDGKETYQYIGEDGASDIKFSPDGKYVSFKRSIEKKSQLFLMRTAGGEAVQLTKHKSSVGAYKWSRDSKRIIFVSTTPRSKDDEKEYKNGLDHIYIDEGPNGQQEGKWENFYVFDIDEKKSTKVTKDEILIGSFDVSPDGQKIVYSMRTENRRNRNDLSEFYLLDLNDSSTTRLTNNTAPESNPLWSPDGNKIAFRANDIDNWELKNAKIWIMDPVTKNSKLVSDSFEGSLRSNFYWTPDSKSIIFSGLQRTVTNIFKLDTDSGSLENLTNSEKGTYRITGITGDRNTMIFSYSDHQTPNDLYLTSVESFNPVRLTDLNPNFQDKFHMAKAETIKWQSSDGLEIEGILYLPEEYSKKDDNQFLLHIHGGPAGVFTDAFSYRYHVWAGLGYIQLSPNVRGSSGYSDDLLRGNMNDIGGMDYEDLMTGVDKLIEEKYINKDKMAVRGWSYGGILGGTTITKTDRFKAASLGAMVSDWSSEYGIGFNYDVRLWYIGGTPWENPEAYREKSALSHVDKIVTPTLLLHGSKDRTDTEAQSMMFFAAIKDIGKAPVRYIQFPREPHGFREPRHQRVRDIEEIKWVQKHTLGLEWEPWERKKEKKGEEGEKPDDATVNVETKSGQ